MLDDVERRPLLIKPSGEDPAPFAFEIAHVELNKGAGIFLRLPGSGAFARAQPHHDILADTNRLTGLELDLAGFAVALVQKAEHGLALGHWRRALGRQRKIAPRIDDFRTRRTRAAERLGQDFVDAVIAAFIAAGTGAQRKQQRRAGE